MKIFDQKISGRMAFAFASMSLALLFSSCSKSEDVKVSAPLFKVGAEINTKTPLSGFIKGTLSSDSTYTVDGDVFIGENDTLVVQPGARIHFPGNAPYCFVVKGTFLSLGTQEKPIFFTVPSAVKTDAYGADPTLDPAFKGLWGGILGDVAYKSIIIKWTHLEFGGGKLGTSPVEWLGNGKNAYTLSSANPDGIFVLEDSWVYGSLDDPFRPFGGKFNIMRNTFEKCGFTGGEAINIKSGSVGNFAYNMVIGMATNGPKASNNGGKNPQTNFYFFNNTIVECGFRRSSQGRGGSTNYEEGSKGACYNNLMVNCKYGPRVVGATGDYNGNALVVADTAHLEYGYNFNYVDDLSTANEIYPTGFGTKPKSTDIPAPSSFLPESYQIGQVYDGSKAIGKNNPNFVGFLLPRSTTYKLGDISTVGNSDFHLKSGSPALNVGYIGFDPLKVVPVDPIFGSSEITAPGKDMGAFQSDGSGNQH
jgi:hypothetical protein